MAKEKKTIKDEGNNCHFYIVMTVHSFRFVVEKCLMVVVLEFHFFFLLLVF